MASRGEMPRVWRAICAVAKRAHATCRPKWARISGAALGRCADAARARIRFMGWVGELLLLSVWTAFVRRHFGHRIAAGGESPGCIGELRRVTLERLAGADRDANGSVFVGSLLRD